MQLRKFIAETAVIALLLGAPAAGHAHFGTITPTDDIVTQDDDKKLGIDIKFIHPMEGQFMEMEKPKQFGVLRSGEKMVKGQPAPNAEVEVEYLNASPGNTVPLKAPSDPYITQVVKADANGVFSYAMPKAGWWGFAALSEASWKMKKDNVEKGIEIGAVYWVHTVDPQ